MIEYKNEKYSTTRLLKNKKPEIMNKPKSKFNSALFLPKNNFRQEGGLRTKGCFKKTYENKPLITVVTIVYNGAQLLEKTILSVIKQNYDNIEYIIIDGNSMDQTIEVINKYENYIDYWVSENDDGISDAFNSGIKVSSGSYLNFLNAGDVFTSEETLNNIVKYLSSGAAIVTFFAKFGDITIPKVPLGNEMLLYKKSRISHQASFIRSDVFKKEGLYRTDLKIRMDYEFWMRVLKKYDFLFVPEIVIDYDVNGLSGRDIKSFYNEEIKINKQHLNFVYALFRLMQIIVIKAIK